MTESYLTLEPSYYDGPTALGPTPRGQVRVSLELGDAYPDTASRLALWTQVAGHLERTGAWRAVESPAGVLSWLNQVTQRSYAPMIHSAIAATGPFSFNGLDLASRLAVAGELLHLGAEGPVRLRATTLLDFVGAGVSTPQDPIDITVRRAADPKSWAAPPALSNAIADFARACLSVESWPGNRAKRYLAERPGIAALI